MFKVNDIEIFTSYSNITLSPTGSLVAFTVAKADLNSNSYPSNVRVLDVNNPSFSISTKGPSDYYPTWISEKELIYLSTKVGDGQKVITELKLLNLNGGEPRTVKTFSKAVSQVEYVRDGLISYLVSEVVNDDPDVILSDVIPIWFNGAGFVHNVRRSLYLMYVNSGHEELITPEWMDVFTYSPSKKGDKVAVAVRSSPMNPILVDIYVIDLNELKPTKVNQEPMYVESINWSTNDDFLIIAGNKQERGLLTHTHLWLVNVENGSSKCLTKKLDRGISKRLYHDVGGPYQSIPRPISDGDYVYFTLSDGGKLSLYRINLIDESIDKVLDGEFSIDEFDVKNGVIAYTKVSDDKPAEVYVLKDGVEFKLTNYNAFIIEKYAVVKPERFTFKASDGVDIEGWIMKPANYTPGNKYPAILHIHGGPTNKFGYAFMFEHQLYASNGYAVIYLNPRGSDGYTQEFADIKCHYGERDYLDIIEGVKYVISNYEFIDPGRIGVTGISYGGFMTNWIITHTDMFKAAVSQNGISDWCADFGTTDIGFYFVPDQICGDPINNREVLISKSPLYNADKVKTPVLFIHSMNDYRCYIDQALTFFTTLKYLGKEAKLALFKEGVHAFALIGKPVNRVKRLKIILEWFDKYLKAR